MDAPRDQFLDVQWGLESYIPSLQQLKGEEEFPCPYPSEEANITEIEELRSKDIIAIEALRSKDADFESPVFWFALWYFIKKYYL